jgi:hypothetical protein
MADEKGNGGDQASKKAVETVEMQDKRKVDFVGKRKLLKETIIDGDMVAVRLDFRNGETRIFKIPDGLLFKFAGHGGQQKLGDECAGIDDVDDMTLAVDDLISRLEKGEWTQKREGTGFGGMSILLRALMELSGKTAEQVKEFLTGKSQTEKMALRNSAKVKPIVEKLEVEKAAKGAKVDTEALLAQL